MHLKLIHNIDVILCKINTFPFHWLKEFLIFLWIPPKLSNSILFAEYTAN